MDIAHCKHEAQGNILLWDKALLNVNEAVIDDDIDPSSFCQYTETFFIIPQKVSFSNGKRLCSIHGGTIAAPNSNAKNEEMVDILKKHKSACVEKKNYRFASKHKGKAAWLGIHRFKNDLQ